MSTIKEILLEHLKEYHVNIDNSTYDTLSTKEFIEIGIDSIKLVSIVTNVCIALDIDLLSFSDDELLNLKSIKDLQLILNSKKNGT